MKKIVLLTDRPEERKILISYLKKLFPECEIEVQPKQTAELKRASFDSELSTFYWMFNTSSGA
jgi:hypothetical protein